MLGVGSGPTLRHVTRCKLKEYNLLVDCLSLKLKPYTNVQKLCNLKKRM